MNALEQVARAICEDIECGTWLNEGSGKTLEQLLDEDYEDYLLTARAAIQALIDMDWRKCVKYWGKDYQNNIEEAAKVLLKEMLEE